MARPPKPIERNGVMYASQNALARAMGVHSSTISKALRKGTLATLTPLAPGEKPHHRVHVRNRQACAAHGFVWGSQRDCAKDLDISESFVCKLLAEGRFEQYVANRKGIRV